VQDAVAVEKVVEATVAEQGAEEHAGCLKEAGRFDGLRGEMKSTDEAKAHA
jgi:hypothetical protein